MEHALPNREGVGGEARRHARRADERLNDFEVFVDVVREEVGLRLLERLSFLRLDRANLLEEVADLRDGLVGNGVGGDELNEVWPDRCDRSASLGKNQLDRSEPPNVVDGLLPDRVFPLG